MKRVLPILLLMLCAMSGDAQFGRSIAFKGAAVARPGTLLNAIQADSVQDWHTGSSGNLMSTTLLQGSATGNTTWNTNSAHPAITWMITNGPNFTLKTPVSVSGTTFTTSGAKAVIQNTADGIDRPVEDFQLSTPSSLTSMQWGFFFNVDSYNTNGSASDNFYDFLWWNDANFVTVVHASFIGGDPTVHFGFHYQLADTSSVSVPFDGQKGKWYYGEAYVGGDGFRYVKFYDPTNSYSLVTGMFGYGGSAGAQFATPDFRANYVPSDGGNTGLVWSAFSWVNWSHISTNGSPWFPNAPTSVSVRQSFDGEATLSWVDSNEQISPYVVSNTVTAAVDSTGTSPGSTYWTNVVVTGLANGSTFSWDVSGFYQPSNRYSSKVTVGPLTIGEVDVTNGLVGEWRFNGNFDDKWNGNNGVPENSPVFDLGAAGARNHSVFLDGQNRQYVLIGNAAGAGLNLQTFTLMAWVKVQSLSNFQGAIFGSNGLGTATPNFYTSGPGGHYFLTSQFTTAIGSSITATASGEWQHVACTYDHSNGNWSFYINGVLDNSGTISPVTFTYTDGQFLQIGWGPQNGADLDSQFHGNIQDFRIYNRVLSGMEIETVYNNTKQ